MSEQVPSNTLSSPRSELWRHMHDEHGLTLLVSELDEIERLAKACSADEPCEQRSFQIRVWDWVKDCFVRDDARTPEQRAFRFMEEALELVQAIGTSREDVLRLVEYVYSRPVGNDSQEFGGVMVTLAALAQSRALDLNSWAENELRRCVANTDKIRAKDLAKPKRSPLPGSTQPPSPDEFRIGDSVRTGPWPHLQNEYTEVMKITGAQYYLNHRFGPFRPDQMVRATSTKGESHG